MSAAANRHPRRTALVSALVWLAAPLPASANDSSFGGEGADLAPLEETRVRMKSEDIVMALGDDALWHVEARYVFENPTDERVDLQVGFPERHCDPDGDCQEGGGRFIGLETKVRGRRVRMRVGSVGSDHAWAPRLGRVFLFDVRFAPGEEVEIVHRYRMHRSTYVETRDEVYYVTRTGSLWAGPIAHARFTVRTPYRPGRLAFPEEYRVARFSERMGDDGPVSEIVFEMRDWTPTHDLDLHLSDTYVVSGHDDVRCPDPGAYGRVRQRLTEEEITAAERRRLRRSLTSMDARARALDARRRRICRNLVFAVHGYHFRSDDLTRLFYRPPARTTDPFGFGQEAERPDAKTYVVMGLSENPDFSQALLTPLERQYLRWLAP